jgi:hypothetical protein
MRDDVLERHNAIETVRAGCGAGIHRAVKDAVFGLGQLHVPGNMGKLVSVNETQTDQNQ